MTGPREYLTALVTSSETSSSAALPRLRQANGDDENGRGLQVVRQLAKRWGARRTPTGKVVWCEQPLPGSLLAEAEQALMPYH